MAYKSKMKLVDDDYEYKLTLQCPHCDEGYLHHSAIASFTRLVEDGDCMLHATQLKGDTGIPSFVSQLTKNQFKNPSERRSGIRIKFDCEICENYSDLCIAQHKGSTYMWMEHAMEAE